MKTFKIFIVLVIVIFTSNYTYSQNNNLNKSDKIETISGKRYYIHTVQKKQTVYSICKLYGISEKDLASNNPALFDGLKEGQELKIPVITDVPKSKDYIYHIVEAKQTAYFIARKYDITVDDLYLLNPEAKNGLSVGQELKIKKKSSVSATTQVAKSKIVEPIVVEEVIKVEPVVSDSIRYIKHKVKKRETLYSISKLYNVSTDDILKANPLVRANGLKKGNIIDIPVYVEKIEEDLAWEGNETIVSDTIVNDSIDCELSPVYENSRVIKIGVLLPFELDIKTLNLELSKQEKSPTTIRPNTKPFFEFYQGLLLSLKQFKKDGFSFDLYVYDTKKSPYTAKSIIEKPEIKQLDFIIGPIYKNIFDTVAKYMPEGISLINPLIDISSVQKETNTIIQNRFSKDVLYKEIVRYVDRYNNVNFIIVHSGNENELKTIEKYKGILLNTVDSLTDTITVKIINFNEGKRKAIEGALIEDRPNIVIIPTSDQGFLTNVITNLHVAAVDDSVILIGMEDWLKYNIEVKYFHSLNLTVFKSRFVDYKDIRVIKFQEEFMNEYGGVPSIYSFVGYDTFKYYTNAFTSLTDNLPNCLDKYSEKGLSQNFIFDKKENNHFVNKGLFILQYNKDFTIELIKE